MSTDDSVDVVVIGGGPAGSTVSTLLAQHGLKVQLFERDKFPRFHIGESLIPETYWVFKRLNMLDKMKASPFVKKYSVQFVNASGKDVGPVLLPRQQAARVLADLAGHPQRVRHDDARQRPRARRRGPPAGPRAGGALRGRPGGRRAASRRRAAAARRCGRRSSWTPAARARCSEPLQAAAVGPGAEQGRHLDLLAGRLPRHRQATRGRRSSSRRRTSRAGGGTSRSTTTPSASASWRRSTTCSRAAAATSRCTTRRWPLCPAVQKRLAEGRAGDRLLRDQGLLVPRRSRWPATAGC